jgi:hypothetical protein
MQTTTKRKPWYLGKNLGFDRPADNPPMSTDPPQGQDQTRTVNDREPWYLGKGLTDWTGKAITGAGETVKTLWDGTKYIPYGGEGSALYEWGKTNAAFDPNLGYSDVLPEDWGQSRVSGAYGNEETDALGNFNRLGQAGRSGVIGDEVVDLRNKLRTGNTAIDNAVAEQDYRAITGQLTDPQSQWYQAQKALLDVNSEDEKRKVLEGLSTSRGIGGGRHDMMLRKLAENQTAQKNAYLATAQKDSEASARANQIALKGLENDILKSAIDVAKTGNQTELEANKATSDYVMNAASQNTQRMAQNLQQSLANMDQQYKSKMLELEKSKNYGDMAKWQNEYDTQRQALLTSQIKTMFGIGDDAAEGAGDTLGGITSFLTLMLGGG